MGTSKRYSAEVRERAVRMVAEHLHEYSSQWAAIVSIAGKIGCHGGVADTRAEKLGQLRVIDESGGRLSVSQGIVCDGRVFATRAPRGGFKPPLSRFTTPGQRSKKHSHKCLLMGMYDGHPWPKPRRKPTPLRRHQYSKMGKSGCAGAR